MQSFNPNQANQPTIQRDSYLFIECSKTSANSDLDYHQTTKVAIDHEFVRENGIGALVASQVQSLVKDGYDIDNVYVGSLL